jgi:hypothetical protein
MTPRQTDRMTVGRDITLTFYIYSSSRTMSLHSTQPPTEISTRNLPGGKGRPARKAELTAVCGPKYGSVDVLLQGYL